MYGCAPGLTLSRSKLSADFSRSVNLALLRGRLRWRVCEGQRTRTALAVPNPYSASTAMLRWQLESGVDWHYIQPDKAIPNAYVVSFNGGLRDECISATAFRLHRRCARADCRVARRLQLPPPAHQPRRAQTRRDCQPFQAGPELRWSLVMSGYRSGAKSCPIGSRSRGSRHVIANRSQLMLDRVPAQERYGDSGVSGNVRSCPDAHVAMLEPGFGAGPWHRKILQNKQW